MDRHFAWQAWRLWHWVGSGGALGQPWRRDAAAFCVAGVALRDVYLHFVWQAWHLTTSIVTLRGRRGTYGTGLALVARLVSHGAVTPRHFAWQAWHFVTSAFTLCGRRGTSWHLPSIHLHFVWQAWHLMTWLVTLRGRRGTYGTGLALVARLVSHGAVTPQPFAWQAWHFVTSAFTLCGRRGTSWYLPSLCVASVALDDMDCYGTWWYGLLLCVAGVAFMALGWLWWRAWSAMAPWRRGVLRGRRGTLWHLRSIHLHFVWQAWHLMTWIVTLRGRRGTYGTGLALVARLVSHGAVTPRRFAWQAWHFVTSAFTLCGRRGTLWHLRSIHLHFVWQAWHLMTWIVTLRGRRGTYGTRLALVARLVSHGAVTPRPFAWQAWRFETSAFTLCGRYLRFVWQAYLILHTQLAPHQSFTISFLFPAFPMLSLPLFCCLSRSWHVGLSGPLITLKKVATHFPWKNAGNPRRELGRELEGNWKGTGKEKGNWKNTGLRTRWRKGSGKTQLFQSRPGKGTGKTRHFQSHPGKGTGKTEHFQLCPWKGTGKTQHFQSKKGSWKNTGIAIMPIRKGVGKAQQLQSRLRKGNGRRPELKQQSARKDNVSRNRKKQTTN